MLDYKFIYFANLVQYCGINLSKSERTSVVKDRRNGYETSVSKKGGEIVLPEREYSLHIYSFGIRLFLCLCHI